MSTYSRIAGTGSYLPEQRLTNHDLVERLAKIGLETSDEWIVSRSGISARHFAADNQLTSDLAVKAAEAALEAAGCTSEDLDLIILSPPQKPEQCAPPCDSLLLHMRDPAQNQIQNDLQSHDS